MDKRRLIHSAGHYKRGSGKSASGAQVSEWKKVGDIAIKHYNPRHQAHTMDIRGRSQSHGMGILLPVDTEVVAGDRLLIKKTWWQVEGVNQPYERQVQARVERVS